MKLKIYQKLLLSFLILAITILAMGYLRGYGTFFVSERNLKKVVGLNSVYSAVEHIRLLISFELIMPPNDYISTADPVYKSDFEKALKKLNLDFKSLYERKELRDEERKVLQDIRKTIDEIIVKKSREIFSLENPVGNHSAMEWMRQIDAEAHKILDLIEHAIDNPIDERIIQILRDSERFKTLVNWVFVLTTAISLFLSYLFASWISNRITTPIKKLRDLTNEVSAGNLKVQIDIKTNDELEDLGNAFNKMAQDLEQDIALRKQTEEKLHQANEFNEAILKGIPFGMDIVDGEGNILYLNEKLAAIAGKDSLGKKCFALYKDDRQQCGNCPLKNGVMIGKIGSIDADGVLGGRIFHITHIGMNYRNKKAILEIFEDITEKRQMEEELTQAEKLYAVGQLASGVVHEVRDPLGIILQGVNYMEKKIPAAQSDILKILGVMKDNIKRTDNIIRSLFDFSKATWMALRPENVNSILEESLELAKQRIKFEGIEIIKETGENIPQVLVDKNRIEQVFINLFLNAADAMPEGGKIIIRSYDKKLETVEDSAGRRDENPFKLRERAAIVEVEDTGVGISGENLKRIFEPFFTTKGHQRGAGLGLSVSRNIIKLHRGLIDVKSQAGKGTKVTITLRTA